MSTSSLGGHVDTFIQPAPAARRTRRRHSAEFKAQIAAACRQPGVSIAAVALGNGLNANLVRRWLVEHEGGARTLSAPSAPTPLPEPPPAFMPLAFAAAQLPAGDIRIELRAGAVSATISWPLSAAEACGAWLRTVLR